MPDRNRWIFLVVILLAGLGLAACQSEGNPCRRNETAPPYLTALPTAAPQRTPTPGPSPTPILIEIGGKKIAVDKVVEGPLCHDTWRGTVYVTCNVQVRMWEKQPDFLKGCNLTIEPDTVVYVAAHNDAAYYNGCSCHFGE
jgi:hypothetical protein